MDSFFYNVGQGFKNIRRNRMFSIASVLTMTTCLFLFGIMYFIVTNLRYMIREAEANVGITVFFNDGTTEQQMIEIRDQIEAKKGVKLVKYVSGDQAWEEFKELYLSDQELLESFGDENPLENSSSFEIFFDTVEDQSKLTSEIKRINGVRQVNDTQQLVQALTKTNRVVSISSSVLIALLLIISLFLISTTVSVGVSVRKNEISIMHLIGATDRFIRFPFIIEGMTLGLLGAALPLSILYAVYYKVIELLGTRFSGLMQSGMDVVAVNDIFMKLSPMIVGIGLGLGLLGSWMTMNRELRKIRHI
ncbi:MAG: permease-like cell division protein FtsX [Lachnospiraceae bacterium]|jgi:cell division transport system permease protein|nr:permease-like cell division protein FtsX [Lachnospiraceae bacterium]